MPGIEAKLDAVHEYLEWNQALPFGAPNDLDAYREHLEVEALRAEA